MKSRVRQAFSQIWEQLFHDIGSINLVHKFGLVNQKKATDLLREQPVNDLRVQ
jgi:hypothetical protein